MRPLLVAAIAAVITLAAPSSYAQYTVKRLVFQGGAPYTQEQLEAASGMKTGGKVGQKEMSDAAQHIMDSGAFGDIEMSLNGPAAGVDVIFKLKPAPPETMLPTSFENIAWLTPEERDTELKKRVPLYGDKLPAAGYLQQEVQTALQAMLTAKGVTATVEGFQKPSTATRPTAAAAFRVTRPVVVLGSVHLDGVTADLAPGERKSIQSVVGRPFNEGIDAHLSDTLLQTYRDAGYIDAKLDNATRTVAEGPNGTAVVTVAARVAPGSAYRISSITWAGSDLFSADDFAKTNKLHAGDIASASAMKLSYQPLLDAYLQRGYVDVSIDPGTAPDAANHTVAYDLKVLPGAVYRVSSVRAEGLSVQAQKDFDSAWRLKQGSVWDAVYGAKFLQMNTALKSLAPYTGKVTTVAHPETHTIDVTLVFFPNNKG